MQNKNVENYMTKSPVIIHENASLEAAWNLLKKSNFKHLPVLNDKDDVTGILSSTDIENLSVIFDNSQNDQKIFLTNLSVKDVMSSKVVTIQKTATIEEANDLILAKGIRALPVVEHNKILGIISETDILHYYNEKYNQKQI